MPRRALRATYGLTVDRTCAPEHADPTSLEEAAVELWQIDWLRRMEGEGAAELWLRPLVKGE